VPSPSGDVKNDTSMACAEAQGLVYLLTLHVNYSHYVLQFSLTVQSAEDFGE
jgi:hypothetical protein